ncbi:MAG: hypothetical protein Q7U57_03780 [Methylovulum sp.]|nr:hypothetical protein [Methylovulum sp.]
MKLSVDNLNLSCLPESAHELVGIGGLEAAIALVNTRGGRRVKWPRYPKSDHFLVPVIGFEALQAYCRYYDGAETSIPKCQQALQWLKHQAILADIKSGLNTVQLAEKHHYTERGMRALRKRLEQRVPCPNRDLFDD